MYLPRAFAEHDPQVLFDFVDAHPLAILVTGSTKHGLTATHLPVVLHRDVGPAGALVGHMARANPQYRQLASGEAASSEALVIFAGPDAYITPSWYPSKQEHGKVVPTWNYVAVHASGTLRFTDDELLLRRHLDELTGRHEAARPTPWHVEDAPAAYITQQLAAIVCFEVRIIRLEGKWKMSQNRSDADVDGVVRGLGASDVSGDREVAALVAARRRARPA